MRGCSVCKKEKSIDQFYPRRKKGVQVGYDNRCMDCRKEGNRKWINKNANYHKDRYGARYKRNINLQREYGITIDQYEAMVELQEGRCAICEKDFGKKLYVDHCHDTGRVRALLCQKCNSGLGMFDDRADLIDRASAYLRAHK